MCVLHISFYNIIDITMRTRLIRSIILTSTVLFTGLLLAVIHVTWFIPANSHTMGTSSRQKETAGSQRRILAGHRMSTPPKAEMEYMFIKKTPFNLIASKNASQRELNGMKKGNVVANEFSRNHNDITAKTSRKNADTLLLAALEQNGRKNVFRSQLKEVSGDCHPQRAGRRMENLFGGRFNASLAPFLTPAALRATTTIEYPPPFGLNGSLQETWRLLQKLPDLGLPEAIKRIPCRRCIVVGNGGLLRGSQAGNIIDRHDVVIRLNMAPVKGYEGDVGSKTSIRLVYPESSVLDFKEYNSGWLLLVIPFKPADIRWTDRVVEGQDTSNVKGFWQETAKFVPKSKEEVRLANPQIIKELATDLIGFDIGSGYMKKNVPTSGVIAIMMAIRICDEVSVAGFGYGNLKPEDPVHYFHDKWKMRHFMASSTHNIEPEREMLRRLVRQGIIQDLTHGLL